MRHFSQFSGAILALPHDDLRPFHHAVDGGILYFRLDKWLSLGPALARAGTAVQITVFGVDIVDTQILQSDINCVHPTHTPFI